MLGSNQKVDDLMRAIARHEGWHPVGSPDFIAGSRSFRHHNPGNLRKSPFEIFNIDNFSVFESDFIGYMALHWDLLQKSRGSTVTGLNGQSTLRELLFIWAPPSDNNDTEAYVRSVERSMGVPATTTLSEIFEN
mgnify:CR=1 FL=1